MSTKSQYAKSYKHAPKFSTRKVRRCWRCGRAHGYMGDFALCRICFRQLSDRGEVTGITRSSW